MDERPICHKLCLWLVDRPGWCGPGKDCCWLGLSSRQPVWKSFLELYCLVDYIVRMK